MAITDAIVGASNWVSENSFIDALSANGNACYSDGDGVSAVKHEKVKNNSTALETDVMMNYRTRDARAEDVKPLSLFFVFFQLNKNVEKLLHRAINKIKKDYSNLSHAQIHQSAGGDNTYGNKLQGASDNESGFIRDFMTDYSTLQKLTAELSWYVTSINRPGTKYTYTEMNQYNRHIYIPEKRSNDKLTISFIDTISSKVEEVFTTYQKLINNDYLAKDLEIWKQDSRLYPYGNVRGGTWGFDAWSNFAFFEQISVLEFNGNRMSIYNYVNPKLESIDHAENKKGDWNPQTIKVNFNFEGTNNKWYDLKTYVADFSETESGLYGLKDSIRKSLSDMELLYKKAEQGDNSIWQQRAEATKVSKIVQMTYESCQRAKVGLGMRLSEIYNKYVSINGNRFQALANYLKLYIRVEKAVPDAGDDISPDETKKETSWADAFKAAYSAGKKLMTIAQNVNNLKNGDYSMAAGLLGQVTGIDNLPAMVGYAKTGGINSTTVSNALPNITGLAIPKGFNKLPKL